VTGDVRAALERHGEAVATVRAFSERSEALRVVLVLDRGEAEPAMLECMPGGALELTDGGRTSRIPADATVPAAPRPLPEVRPPPPSSVHLNVDTGELEAPLGAVANLARAVLALASAFGGRSVATAEFATRDPAVELTIAAREGEPLVFAAGDRRYVLPEGALDGSP
jgi:hypothetical protein